MTSLTIIPTELLILILDQALAIHPHPSHILALNKFLHNLAQPLLYAHPRLTSVRALSRFPSCPPRRPCTVTVALPGGEVGNGQFRELEHVFMKCIAGVNAPPPDNEDCTAYASMNWLTLDALELCMNSTANAVADDISLEALSLANPQRFVWTGPDPPHHFSTAIGPTTCRHLFSRLSLWTRLRHLHLANIAFPHTHNVDEPEPALVFPVFPSLVTLYIGQATFLPLDAVAGLTCDRRMEALREVRLVDCYVQSIWGARVRRGDVERAAVGAIRESEGGGYGYVERAREARVWRVRAVVRCEAVTERIMGGDRVEGLAVLE